MMIDNQIMCKTNLISFFSAFLMRLTGRLRNVLDARISSRVTFARKINYIGVKFSPLKGWNLRQSWEMMRGLWKQPTMDKSRIKANSGRIAQWQIQRAMWQRRWEWPSLNNILCNINAPLKQELPKTFDRDFADSISEVEEVEETVLEHLTSPEASQGK